ncbi:MAG: energy-coupled thiamine transporter ThiT [Clostridia bacterium]|nr:energy-coupled thiamine transporter ThiT [Clostridia bacterium]
MVNFMENSKKPLYKLCECAVLVAISVAVSFFEIKIGALGGSVDFVMIPLFIICYRHGIRYSFISCFCFALLYCLVGGKFGYGLPSVILDYLLAYTVIGFSGFFSQKSKLIEVSVFVGCLLRFSVHFISGITLYRIATATEVAGVVTSNAVLFSLIYNGLYMLPNTVFAIIIMSLLRIPLKKLK